MKAHRQYALGVYEKALPNELSIAQKLEAAKIAGYDFMELSIDETDEKLARLEWTSLQRKQIKDSIQDIGVPIETMCLSGHRKYPLGSNDPVIVARSLEIMEKAIDLASDLGIKIIQLAGYDVYYEDSSAQTKARFGENLKKCVDMAAKKGVILGFETMETEFMNTVTKAMAYVKLIDSPYLHVYPDCGNLKNASVTYNSDVYDDIRSGKGHLVAMHLKETVPGVFREVPYGTGHIDFPAMIDMAWDLGVRRFVSEFWYVDSLDYQGDLNDVRSLFGTLLDKKMEETLC